MTDWPPELREKAREAFWGRKDADPDERLLDALDAIADDVVLKQPLRYHLKRLQWQEDEWGDGWSAALERIVEIL